MRKSTQDYIREALAAADIIANEVPTPPPVGRSLSTGLSHPRYPRQTSTGLKVVDEPQSMGVDSATFQKALQKLLAATGGRAKVVSGTRSTARQTQLWNDALRKYGSAAKARKWVAPPGRSRHEKGLAADLGGDINLAAKLAGQFGLHRPMAHEPWHFELKGSRRK